MQARPIPRWLGVLLLLAIAVTFGSNDTGRSPWYS